MFLGTVIVSTALRMYSLAVDSGLEKWNVRLTNEFGLHVIHSFDTLLAYRFALRFLIQ